jgi:hypothetical protein
MPRSELGALTGEREGIDDLLREGGRPNRHQAYLRTNF